MSSASDNVESRQHSTEKNSEQTLDRSTAAMADSNEKQNGDEISQQSDSDKDVQYVTSFKLAAIMVTINLSTMVAALDLVRIEPDRKFTSKKKKVMNTTMLTFNSPFRAS